MKKITLLLVLSLILVSCKNEAKKENFPNELSKVFTKHGIDIWKNAKVLSFNKGDEVHTADLQNRKTVINHPNYSLGFDGKEVWLDETEEGSFKGNKNFYYNLFFYFYAMPFVLADDGITYSKSSDLVFKGVNYPGYKISYASDKGSSPDDNYIIYFNPESYKMEWLAYTVTFNSKKPSNTYNLIKYSTWENVNGLLLPKEIQWYKKDEKGNPTESEGEPLEFTLPLVSQGKLADSFFVKPL